MNDQENNLSVEQRVTLSLDEDVSHLDAATLSRLRQARERALASRQKSKSSLHFWALSASAALLIVFVSLNINFDNRQPPLVVDTMDIDQLETLELLTINDDVELDFYEDLDFYEWLESQDSAT